LFSQNYNHFTTRDGLPNNHVYKLTQDYKGFIWFATDKGLVKYNGNTMKSFTTKEGLAINDIWNMLPTQDGKLWFLSKTSALGYIENDSVYNFKSELKGEIFNPIFTSHLTNEIILNSPSKSHQLKEGQWQVILDNNFKTAETKLHVKHHQVKNIELNAIRDSMKINTKSGKTKWFSFKNKLSGTNKRAQITDSLYYWADINTYYILNLNSQQLYSKTFKKQVGIEQVRYPRINLINNELQITGKGFVGILDSDFNIKNTFYFPEKLDAHFGLIDLSGNIWLTTFNNGVYQFSKEKQDITYHLQNDKILGVKNINDRLLVSVFHKGFYEYDPKNKSLRPFIIENDFFFNASYINELDTEYYLANQYIYSIKNHRIFKKKYTQNLDKVADIYRQFVYFKGSIYAIYSTGVAKLNPKTLNEEAAYNQYGITRLFVFDNRLLIATVNGLKELKDHKIESVNFENQLFNKPIISMVKVTDHQCLINTDGFGAYLSDLNTITQLPKSEFLIVNNAFVNNQSLWLATNSGVLQYDKYKDKFQLSQQLDMSYGLPSNQINSVFVHENEMLISTNSGLATLPLQNKNTSSFIDIYFDGVQFNNQPITNQSIFNYLDNNNLNVSVSSIDFSSGNNILSYKYKLHPLQKNWISSTAPTINFNNLQPKEYTLFIEKNDIEKTFSFTIKPLWWQTIWFKLLSGFIIVFSTLYLVWIWSKQIQKKKDQKIIQEKQLSEIQLKALRSQMNPHFVFNSLNAIQYYINNNETVLSEKYLIKFSKLIRMFFDFSQQQFVTLEEEITLLTNYLEMEKMRFGDKLSFYIEKDMDLKQNIKLPSMILQPIVENAVNHGIFHKKGKGTVRISITKPNTTDLKVSIKDDGIGINQSLKQRNNRDKTKRSSENILTRIQLLNATKKWDISYDIKDLSREKKTGTIVVLYFSSIF
jgi:two-component sensor histidine kinase